MFGLCYFTFQISVLQQHQQCRLEPGNNQSVDGVDGGNCTLPGSNQFIPSGISPPNNQYSSQWGPVYGTPPQVNSNSQPIDVLMIQRQQLQDQIQQSEQNLSAQQQVFRICLNTITALPINLCLA